MSRHSQEQTISGYVRMLITETADAGETLVDDIQKALLQLPLEFREAVVLCDVIGLSYEEIALAAAVPIGTVRSRIHRGRKILRELLA